MGDSLPQRRRLRLACSIEMPVTRTSLRRLPAPATIVTASLGTVEHGGEHAHQLGVGPALARWGGEAHAQTLAGDPGDLAAPRARVRPDGHVDPGGRRGQRSGFTT